MSLTDRLGVKARDYQIMSRGLYSQIRGERGYSGVITSSDYPAIAASIAATSRIFLFHYIDELAHEKQKEFENEKITSGNRFDDNRHSGFCR